MVQAGDFLVGDQQGEGRIARRRLTRRPASGFPLHQLVEVMARAVLGVAVPPDHLAVPVDDGSLGIDDLGAFALTAPATPAAATPAALRIKNERRVRRLSV